MRGRGRPTWAPPIGILKGRLLCYFFWRRGSKRRRQEELCRPRHPWFQGQTSPQPLRGIRGPRDGPQVRNPIGMMMQNFRPGYIRAGGVAHAVSRRGLRWRGGKSATAKVPGDFFLGGSQDPERCREPPRTKPEAAAPLLCRKPRVSERLCAMRCPRSPFSPNKMLDAVN